jgi:hypothetical protein
MGKEIRRRRREIASKRNIFRRCLNTHVRVIPVLPEPWPMKCENDSMRSIPDKTRQLRTTTLGIMLPARQLTRRSWNWSGGSTRVIKGQDILPQTQSRVPPPYPIPVS